MPSLASTLANRTYPLAPPPPPPPQRAHARPGQVVFVHGGSGAVGVATIQFARAAGLTVIASAGTAQGLEFVKAVGAHHAVNHREDGYLDTVRTLTAATHGPELIVEMIGAFSLVPA